MYTVFDAHPATLMIVMAAVLVTPLHLMCTFAFSGASARKGAILGALVLVWGAFMSWVCLAGIVDRIGPPLGNLIVPIAWFAPSLVIWLARDWLLAQPLSQRWLLGLQVWRVIGALFLLELVRGQLPAIFAVPAGVGDVLVAASAAAVPWLHRAAKQLPRGAIVLVAALGVLDFISAFFFGFTSTPGRQQLFFPDVANRVLIFPTGMIPLFLVPYAIGFHTLSLLSLYRTAAAGAPLERRLEPHHG